MFKSSNPAFKAFEQPQTWASYHASDVAKPTTMTIGGVAQATGIFMGITMAAALATWMLFSKGVFSPSLAMPMFFGALVVSIILQLIVNRNHKLALRLGIPTAVAEGVLAGAVSFLVAATIGAQLTANPELVGGTAAMTPEVLAQRGAFVVFQAVFATAGVVGAILIAVSTGIVAIRGKAAKVVVGLVGAAMTIYMVSFVLNMLGMQVPYIHSAGPIGIAFTSIMVIVASLYLAMQFTQVQDAVAAGAPKALEWQAAFGIMISIVWLYFEILMLLYKIYLMTSRN